MASGDVNLGAVSLVSTTLGYQILLTSQCHFALSARDEICSLQQLTSRLFDPDRDRKPWVARGRDFRLVLHIDSNEEAMHGDIMEALSQRLLSSQTWDQLGLCPLSIKTASHESARSHVSIHLDHTDDTRSKPGRAAHKLSGGAPFSHVQPPIEIKTILLEQVLFHLKLSNYQRKSSVKRSTASKQEQEPRNVESALNPVTEDCPADQFVDNPSGLNSYVPEEFERDDMYRSEPVEPICHSADQSHRQSKIDAILQMIQSGVTYGISPWTKSSENGIKVDCRESFYALTDVAPTLWAPGFISSISEKTLFLPTISHSLTSVGQGSYTALLRKGNVKIKELCHRHKQANYEDTNLSVQSIMAESLWHMLQRAELRHSGSKKLKALFKQSRESETHSNKCANFKATQNDALDEGESDEKRRQDLGDPWLFCDDFDDSSDDMYGVNKRQCITYGQYDNDWTSGETEENRAMICNRGFDAPKRDSWEDCSLAESVEREMENMLEAW